MREFAKITHLACTNPFSTLRFFFADFSDFCLPVFAPSVSPYCVRQADPAETCYAIPPEGTYVCCTRRVCVLFRLQGAAGLTRILCDQDIMPSSPLQLKRRRTRCIPSKGPLQSSWLLVAALAVFLGNVGGSPSEGAYGLQSRRSPAFARYVTGTAVVYTLVYCSMIQSTEV